MQAALVDSVLEASSGAFAADAPRASETSAAQGHGYHWPLGRGTSVSSSRSDSEALS